ncbi:MAG: glycosyltransferase family 4 protein [Anaerolineales bacterium]
MRILYVADARSPIALGWIGSFVEAGHEVHVVSTNPCGPVPGAASTEVVPVGFSGLRGDRLGRQPDGEVEGRVSRQAMPWLLGAGSIRLRLSLRHWLGPATILPASRRLRAILAHRKPDLVHALRLPMEGMLAAAADPACPLLISIWGNDFTLHAPAAPGMRRLTRAALRRADGLHADSRRDIRLAASWGFAQGKPTAVLPSNGGVRLEWFHPARGGQGAPLSGRLADAFGDGDEHAVNPRGFRGYVRNDTFFRTASLLQAPRPGLRWLCPSMAGDSEAERWVGRLGIGKSVHFLPRLGPAEMAEVFRRSAVSVSPSVHDGTPNTLLEAMACGAFPICGDLESIREWIEDGVNGILLDAGKPAQWADAVGRVLDDAAWRARAAEKNWDLVQKAERQRVFTEAESFCRSVAGGRSA